MERVDTASAVGTYAGFGVLGTPGHFSPGNPTVGQRGTIPGADWFEQVQEEFMSVQRAGGIVNQKGNTRQLYQAVLAMQVFFDTGVGGANTLTVSPLVAFDAVNPNTVFWLVPAISNTGSATLNIGVGGAKALLRPDGTGLQAGDMIAGRPSPVFYSAGSWYLLVWPTRPRLGAALALYVSPAGNDGNSGLSAGAAFLTPQRAWNSFQNIDLNGQVVTINLAAGTYPGFQAVGYPVGSLGLTSVVFNGASAAGTIISGVNLDALFVGGGAAITVQHATLQSTGAGVGRGSGIEVSQNGIVAFNDIIFGACSRAHVTANVFGSLAETPIGGAYTISGAAPIHLNATNGGQIALQSAAVTLSGTPNFSTAFAQAADIALISISGTFAGAATGARYGATGNGVIDTSGSGASYLPGNSAGSTLTGGQYI